MRVVQLWCVRSAQLVRLGRMIYAARMPSRAFGTRLWRVPNARDRRSPRLFRRLRLMCGRDAQSVRLGRTVYAAQTLSRAFGTRLWRVPNARDRRSPPIFRRLRLDGEYLLLHRMRISAPPNRGALYAPKPRLSRVRLRRGNNKAEWRRRAAVEISMHRHASGTPQKNACA